MSDVRKEEAMGRRMFAVVALVVGLVLLLALAVAVQAAEVVRTERPSPNIVPAGPVTRLTDPRNPASLDHTSGLAITPALTAYLPILSWGYPPCAVAPAHPPACSRGASSVPGAVALAYPPAFSRGAS